MISVKNFLLAIVASAGCVTSFQASAGIINYSFRLEIQTVAEPNYSGRTCQEYIDATLTPSFGCNLTAGSHITGGFSLRSDPELLANGIYSFLPLNSWAIRIGEVEWDINRASSDFLLFRDGTYCGASGTGFSQINPGLDIRAGVVSGFCGGVAGSGDTPFIDFDYFGGRGTFMALDSVGVRLSGRYSINAVPQPAGVALAGLALSLLVISRRTKGPAPN